MTRYFVRRQRQYLRAIAHGLCLGVVLLVGLMGCAPDSDTGTRPPPPDPADPLFVSQGIREVVEHYQTAFRSGDIDQLQPLLRPADDQPTTTILGTTENLAFLPNGCPVVTALTAAQYRASITDLLQQFRVLALHTQILSTDASSAEPIVSLQETISLEDTTSTDNTRLAQRTCVSNLTLRLTRQPAQTLQDQPGVIITDFLIEEAIREGPIFQIEMPGRAQAGALSRVEVAEVTDTFLTRQVMLKTHDQEISLQRQEDQVFRGAVMLPDEPSPASVQVTIRGETTGDVIFHHTYQTRRLTDRAAQRVSGTAGGAFRTLVEGADGTIWAGAVGTRRGLYQIDPQERSMTRRFELAITNEDGTLTPPVDVEDLTIDERERLHAVFLLRNQTGIQGNGVIVLTQLDETLSACQTVNAQDDNYPFRVQNSDSGKDAPSPSVRAIPAGGDDIWLFGSDGGVARVIDGLQSGTCGDKPIYISCFSRQVDTDCINPQSGAEDNRLLTNTVPTFVASQDGALWFGTALGLMRWRDGQFTSIPFDPVISITPGQLPQDQLSTLESFIGSVADAIFEAQPIETVMIGNLSFLDFFGRALVKEDFSFSAVEDQQNRLWIGTVGGGLRRIEAVDDTFQDTIHITRESVSRLNPSTQTRSTINSQGQLVSNVIFAIDIAPNGDVWAATEKGVSQIQERADVTVVITNYTALDGLTLPVRDVLVSETGAVWLATDGGVYKLISEAAQLQGTVVQFNDQTGLESPVEGADIILRNTPFRAVTDDRGIYSLSPLPLNAYTVQVQGDHAIDGPFAQTFDAAALDTPEPFTRQFVVVRRELRVPIDPIQGGIVTFPTLPESEIALGPEGPAFPSEIGLTLLPVDSLPPPPVTSGLTLIAAAELQPDHIELTQPFTLTLPNRAPLPQNTFIFLSCLKTDRDDNLDYAILGSGRVSQDGLTNTGTSFDSVLPVRCPILGFQALLPN